MRRFRCPAVAGFKPERETEVNLAGTDVSEPTSGTQNARGFDMKLEVVAIPVSDVDRAKSFYQSLGWRLDADFDLGEVRVVQFTPPHSECSIGFGKGFIKGEPGSVERLELVVSDIEAAREDLISRGVEVSDFFHRGESGFEPGLDPERTSYNSYATFNDPDGNGFILQEVTERLPGRVWEG
jgi:catechol 2,3-dioxygenase-like lactoylglutathione lyase family enzyme